MLAYVTDLRLAVIMPDGGAPAVDPPRECALIAGELRSMMYRTGEGTWFGMRFMMDPPSAYWISFNGDFDPLWDPPVPPEAWAGDLAVFPAPTSTSPAGCASGSTRPRARTADDAWPAPGRTERGTS